MAIYWLAFDHFGLINTPLSGNSPPGKAIHAACPAVVQPVGGNMSHMGSYSKFRVFEMRMGIKASIFCRREYSYRRLKG